MRFWPNIFHEFQPDSELGRIWFPSGTGRISRIFFSLRTNRPEPRCSASLFHQNINIYGSQTECCHMGDSKCVTALTLKQQKSKNGLAWVLLPSPLHIYKHRRLCACIRQNQIHYHRRSFRWSPLYRPRLWQLACLKLRCKIHHEYRYRLRRDKKVLNQALKVSTAAIVSQAVNASVRGDNEVIRNTVVKIEWKK